MSHTWVLDNEQRWQAHRLVAAGHDLHALLLPAGSGGAPALLEDGRAARLLSVYTGNAERWAVVAGPAAQLRVNGIPLGAVGARVLGDRDEIALPGVGSAYFSTESLAEVVAFPGADRAVFCWRCRREIKPGELAVCCPACRIWFHQTPDFKCWRYSDTCSCSQSTALDTGFHWVPEEE